MKCIGMTIKPITVRNADGTRMEFFSRETMEMWLFNVVHFADGGNDIGGLKNE